MYKTNNVLIIGDLMLDIYYRGLVGRISPEAPVPVFKKKKEESFVPGGAGNVATNMVAAGITPVLMGVVGDDEHGEKLIHILHGTGIDISHIDSVETDTISKIRFLSENNQQMLRMDIEDVNEYLDRIPYADMLQYVRDHIGEYGIVVLSDYLKGMLTPDFTQDIIRTAKEYGARVLIDVKDPDYTKYVGAWLLKPNLKELASLTKKPVSSYEEIIEAGQYLREMTECEYVLITCGSDGMVLIGRDKVNHLNTAGREVYDVTGAGDTVIAYLAVCLAEGKDILQAMEIANYAAGIQVGKVGTSVVYRKEVEDVMSGLGSTYMRKKLRWRDLDSFVDKNKDKKIIFTNGCFDILHVGHKRYLEEARALGDMLIVGVNSDDSVRRLKGTDRPVNPEQDRVELLTALDCVDKVIVFEDDTPFDLIDRIRPAVIVKGGDYTQEEVVGKDIVEQYGGEVVIIPLIQGKSTTAVIEKIKE